MDWNLVIWTVIIIAGAWLLGAFAARLVVGIIIAKQAKKVFSHVNDTLKDRR